MIRPDNERKKTMILIALPIALRGVSTGGISGRDSPDRELKNERIRTLLRRQIRDAEFAGAGDGKHRPPVHSPYERCRVGHSMCVAGLPLGNSERIGIQHGVIIIQIFTCRDRLDKVEAK